MLFLWFSKILHNTYSVPPEPYHDTFCHEPLCSVDSVSKVQPSSMAPAVGSVVKSQLTADTGRSVLLVHKETPLVLAKLYSDSIVVIYWQRDGCGRLEEVGLRRQTQFGWTFWGGKWGVWTATLMVKSSLKLNLTEIGLLGFLLCCKFWLIESCSLKIKSKIFFQKSNKHWLQRSNACQFTLTKTNIKPSIQEP